MKTLKIFLFLLIVSASSFAQQFRKIELQAAGLTCSMCSNAINKALKQVGFIETVQTDLQKSVFTISVRNGMSPDFDVIRKKVEDAGFSVAKMTVEVNFNNEKIASDAHAVVGGKAFHFLNTKQQTVNGWQKIQFVDNSFLVASEAKKWKAATSMACYKTGMAASCCSNADIKIGQRIYHVTI